MRLEQPAARAVQQKFTEPDVINVPEGLAGYTTVDAINLDSARSFH
jgi:hypothetical protein